MLVFLIVILELTYGNLHLNWVRMKYLITFLLLFSFLMVDGQSFVKDFFSVEELVTVGENSFFVASRGTQGLEMYKTNGTSESTVLVKDINPINGSFPDHLFAFNGEVYFSANEGFFGTELWKTDGTEAGTVLVKNIHPYYGQGSNPNNFTIYNNELYFLATDYYSFGSYSIWKTDGTESGTIKVYDNGASKISGLYVANNKLYVNIGVLAEFDTATNLLTPLVVDSEYPVIDEINSFENGLYFITSINFSRQNIRLYRLDESGNVLLLKEFNQPANGDIDIHNLTQVGSEVYFSITTDFNSQEDTDVLWKTDGTSSNTLPVKSFGWDRFTGDSKISNFIEYNNELFFDGGSKNNHVLWKSNGSESGTVKVNDIPIDRTVNFVILDGMLYFTNNQNLWFTDGSAANTKKFSDLKIPGTSSNDIFNVKVANDKIIFEALYLDTRALYTTKPNPIIEIRKNNSVLQNNSTISFESKIDSVVSTMIKVKNLGKGDLAFSRIWVDGQDFYIDGQQQTNVTAENSNGNFPQIVTQGMQAEFKLSFYPSSEGLKKGTLNILSNDLISPSYMIELVGFSEDEIAQSLDQIIKLEKEINFHSSNLLINIDNNTVQENAAINTLVGILNISNSNENYSYELNDGLGNTDNPYFTIENNELKTNGNFDFEQKNTFVISVKATNSTTSETILGNLVIKILDEVEASILEACNLGVENLGFGLNDVQFIDELTALAVGNHGAILKSDDGGETWRRVSGNLKKELYHLQFTSPSIGYAIGSVVLKTEDAGESWFLLQLSDESYPFPRNLFFVNSNLGFVFGADGKIFKTTDGGRYWKLKDLGSIDFNSAFFLNESKGYLVGRSETLMKTVNGGETWENVDLGIEGLRYDISLTNIYFVDDAVGFITGNRGEIIKTLDGGETWELASKLEYDITTTDIYFFDENLGYVLTESYLYKTEDGGLTWNNDLPFLYSGLQGIDFNSNGNKGSIVGHGTSCCTGPNTGNVIYTKEFNDNWKTISYLSLRSDPLTAVNFEGENGIVFGRGIAAKTSDGGYVWKDITSPEEYIYQVESVNGNFYLLGQNKLYKSVDNGDSWEVLSDSNQFKKLFFINEQTIFAASFGLGVFKSVDGGINWVNIGPNPSYGLNLFFVNENEGFVVGISDGMFRTLDGGNTWNQIVMDQTDDAGNQPGIYSVVIFNNIGFAGSSLGLLKTNDGGNSWTSTDQYFEGEVKFIHAINELEWYVSSRGRLFKTNDGGASWKIEYFGEEVTDAHFTQEKAYLVGYRNLVKIDYQTPPTISTVIEGDNVVESQSREEYSINNNSDTNYRWAVSGDNEISYKGNRAQVFWNLPGTYIVSVTPFNNCGDGPSREISVTVVDIDLNPEITGDQEVDEFSSNHEYLTSNNSGSRYNWFVNGYQDFIVNENTVNIDWGAAGLGAIQVVETDINSGIRKQAFLNVTINPAQITADNFTIEVIGETCPNKNNGKILISANQEYNYLVTLNGSEYNFTDTLTIENLPPNNYQFCIAVASGSYTQCYNIDLPKSAGITGRFSSQSGGYSINIDSGTPPFSVSINDELKLVTSSTSAIIDVKHGDFVEVKSNNACEGSLTKLIDLFEELKVYPNPTNGIFEITVPVTQKALDVDVFNLQSQLISSKSYPIQDGKIKLNIGNNSRGLYIVKVYLDHPIVFKILKQ